MRIVGGAYRGRALVAPKGQSTRPAADRARQAMFDVLEHASWSPGLHGARVIDLFAGSGALGLEALSRGAAHCVFVDRDRAALEAIADNLKSLGVERERYEVLRSDAASARLNGVFDLVLLDPPYGKGMAATALAGLAGKLAPDALVVVERGAAEPPLSASGYALLDERRWGVAKVAFLRRSNPPDPC